MENNISKEFVKKFKADFSSFTKLLDGNKTENLNSQSDYIQKFIAKGLPNNKSNEAWKHSPASLFPNAPIFSSSKMIKDISSFNFEEADNFNIFNFSNYNFGKNGVDKLLEEKNLPKEMTVSSSKKSKKSKISKSRQDLSNFESGDDNIVILNKAISPQEITFTIHKDLKKPLLFLFDFTTDQSIEYWSSITINFEIKSHVQCSLITKMSGNVSNLSNVFTFNQEENSSLNHLNIIETSNRYFGANFYQLKKDACLNSFSISNKTAIARQNIEVSLEGTQSNVSLNGIFETCQKHHCDLFTLVKHKNTHTQSSQLFKAIARDHSRGIYNGKVVIEKDCSHSKSEQLSRNIIKDKAARIYSRPQLEVYNDDVECSHGSTYGQLSKDELFYLISRGISKSRAEDMLQFAFYNEVIEKISNHTLQKYAKNYIFEEN